VRCEPWRVMMCWPASEICDAAAIPSVGWPNVQIHASFMPRATPFEQKALQVSACHSGDLLVYAYSKISSVWVHAPHSV